jgi:hypothetical protein
VPLKELPRIPQSSGSLWSADTRGMLERGAILPVISNYLLPRIFGGEAGDVAATWAEAMQSPLAEQENRDLARLAQFHGVDVGSHWQARQDYHTLLKRYLLGVARESPADGDVEYADDLLGDGTRFEAASLSDIARDLGYPRFEDPTRNPMRLLAELPLPVYLTTGQHSFLELALQLTGFKQPVTEIFYWDTAQHTIPSVYDREPDYQPSVERPLVYHLFGVDEYPSSMVLTEDDYISVLMRLSELKRDVKVGDSGRGGTGSSKLDLPAQLKTKLSGDGLLLLGYNVHDWDFRVLFRWLAGYIGDSRAGRSAPHAFCLQVRPTGQPGRNGEAGKVEEYLRKFFEQKSFTVYWGDTESCVHDLWSRWKRG